MVDGHELHEEDLRLMYTFDQSSGSAPQYEAHSDAQVYLKFKNTFVSVGYSKVVCTLNTIKDKSATFISAVMKVVSKIFLINFLDCKCCKVWSDLYRI